MNEVGNPKNLYWNGREWVAGAGVRRRNWGDGGME
jgi:hypothetical protein